MLYLAIQLLKAARVFNKISQLSLQIDDLDPDNANTEIPVHLQLLVSVTFRGL